MISERNNTHIEGAVHFLLGDFENCDILEVGSSTDFPLKSYETGAGLSLNLPAPETSKALINLNLN